MSVIGMHLIISIAGQMQCSQHQQIQQVTVAYGSLICQHNGTATPDIVKSVTPYAVLTHYPLYQLSNNVTTIPHSSMMCSLHMVPFALTAVSCVTIGI